MKNLVMAVATGYGWHDLEPFIISCKKHCPDADLVLFVDNLSKFTQDKLKDKVILQPIPENLKSMSVVCSRFIMYKDFLDAHNEYENIFVSDIRDVIFQGDIFKAYDQHKNFLVYATEAELIKNDRGNNNQTWIKRFFGETEYQNLKDKIIICAGTVLGSRAELQIFFDNMIKTIANQMEWGKDQAALNYLVHDNLVPIENLIESNVNDGAIFTTGIIDNPKVSDDNVLRGDGNIPAVVHQYTDKPQIIQIVDKIYREENFSCNANFTDFVSTLDQTFCLVQVKNFDAATKIFVQNILFEKDLKPYGDKLLKLGDLILQRYNHDADILFVAVQKTLLKAFKINIDNKQMNKFYNLQIQSEKILPVVNSEFKNFVKNLLATFVDIFYKNNLPQLAMTCTKRLAEWK